MPSTAASPVSEPIIQGTLPFGRIGGKQVEIRFDEPLMSSDGGVLLVKQTLDDSGISKRMADAIGDGRDQAHCRHSLEGMISQRILQVCQGSPDVNDATECRHDPLYKLAVGEDALGAALASQPTLSRLENSMTLADLRRLGEAILEGFIDSFQRPPRAVCIDIDPSAHEVYGQQELGLFAHKLDGHCLMPFYVFDGITGKLITAVIRPGKTPSGKEIMVVLKRVIGGLQRAWPNTRLFVRGDSHHARAEVLDFLDREKIGYVLGLQTNERLRKLFGFLHKEVKDGHSRTLREYRRFHSAGYQAKSWPHSRRVICRALATENGTDLRYIVTNLNGAGATYLYETVYCARGKMELWIKEMKLDLYSDRSSCTSWRANQFRLFLHAAAYQVMDRMRRTVLAGTALANATFGTIRLRLLKVAARVVAKKTRVRIHLPAAFAADRHLWQRFAAAPPTSPG
jgi:hypothetical protein